MATFTLTKEHLMKLPFRVLETLYLDVFADPNSWPDKGEIVERLAARCDMQIVATLKRKP